MSTHHPYKVMVVGCGRSGTTFLAQWLQRQGVKVGHETLGVDGVVGWNAVFAFNPMVFEHIWHLVRHPLKVIASTTAYKHWGTRGWMALPPDDQPVLRGLFYWVRWNRLCESIARKRFRVEDVAPRTATAMLMRSDLHITSKDVPWPDMPTNVHSRKHRDLTWDDLCDADEALALEARRLATNYGYDT